jgi:TIR domain
MAFVSGYAHDIFVSYAHVDDLTDQDGVDGWVTTLIKKLTNRLAQLLGRQDNFSIWYDHHLSHHVNITPEIFSTLEKTATLVVVLSPGYLASEWCQRERHAFLKLVQRRLRDDARVFLLHRDKLELDERPEEFGDLLGYRFWVQDRPGKPPRILGMTHAESDEDAYFDVLNDLAWELSKKLKQLRNSAPAPNVLDTLVTSRLAQPVPAVDPACTATVYLAEVTDDLDGLRNKVIRSLQQRNIRVIPDTWYPRDPQAFRAAVEGGLNDAELFVQLLGRLPGRKPPELKEGYVGFQHLRAREIGLPILQWRNPALDVQLTQRDVEDAEHRALLLGATVQAIDIEDFCREIVQQVERTREERKKNPSRDAFVFVNVHLDYDGAETAAALCRYLEQRGIGYVLPINTGQAEEIREDLEANLLDCDGMIIVYGRVSSAWVRGQLREFRKLAYRREKAARALAVFQWPPVPKDPIGFQLPKMTTIDCTAGMDESRLRVFFDNLLSEVVV